MNCMAPLSRNTLAYLEVYQAILDTMIDQMTSIEQSQSISGHFILQMIPHHRAAIDMSENLLQYTVNIPLQNIALDIIDEQIESIKNMEEVFPRCMQITNSCQDLESYHKQTDLIMRAMFDDMRSAAVTNSIDANFIREMIPHHEGAIQMSNFALCYPICSDLVPILDAIIVSQKRGVRQMQRLLKTVARR